jgi:nitrate/nitrite transport system substrate-binding protein
MLAHPLRELLRADANVGIGTGQRRPDAWHGDPPWRMGGAAHRGAISLEPRMAAPDKTDTPINPKRRRVVKTMASVAGGTAMALIDPLVRAGAWAAGSDAPEKTELKVGFIPLTDCASVVMASTLGIDKKYGIKITPSKEASWAGVRDKLVSGDLDAAHVLYGLIYGVQLGIGGPKKDMAVLMTLNNNGQAITLSSKLKEAGVRDGASLPQMVANMRVGNMDGYCVGEPWGARAIADNIGFTAETTQAIWKDHPEKVLGTTAEFVQKYPNTARALTAAVLEASKFIDASASNRRKTAETVAAKSYVNTDMDIILDRMLGRYTNGLGKTWDDPDPMRFYHDGAVNFPYLSDGMWFLTQHKRWGLLKTHPDYLAIARQVNRVDIFKQAATATGTPVPKSDMRTAKLIDGVVWDAKNPAAYADGFKIKA